MEYAVITHLDKNKKFGFARVIDIENGQKFEEIYFRFDCVCRIKPDGKLKKSKPKFKFKKYFNQKKIESGTIIAFIRKKTPRDGLRDSAKLWGLKEEYKKVWTKIDNRAKNRREKMESLERVFEKISAESSVNKSKAV